MRTRAGPALRDRPVVDAAGKPIKRPSRRRTRHCWVQGPAEDPGEREGLVVAWVNAAAGWQALVVYVLAYDGASAQEATVIHTWVPADRLRSAG